MTTAVDLITLALKDIGALGIGQSISADDTSDALSTLNMMLGQWTAERLDIYHLVETVLQSTGAQSYTIGAGGNFNTPRPFNIASAFCRLNNVDFPIQMIKAREDYNLIGLKSLNSMPQYLFYDSAFPLGNLYFYPIPNSTYELHITTMDVLAKIATPATTINLPAPYMAMIRYNLALWLAPSYQIEPMPQLRQLAQNATKVVKRSNVQIQQMRMPRMLMGKSRYSIFGDTVY